MYDNRVTSLYKQLVYIEEWIYHHDFITLSVLIVGLSIRFIAHRFYFWTNKLNLRSIVYEWRSNTLVVNYLKGMVWVKLMIIVNIGALAWNYKDKCGIPPKTCIHHIYTQENARHVWQPQRRMNPTLKDILKEELQKLLNANFKYPISDRK